MKITKVFLNAAIIFTIIGVVSQLSYFLAMSLDSLINIDKETLKLILLILPFAFGISSICLLHYLNEKKYWFSLVTWILTSIAFLVFSILLYQAEIDRSFITWTGITFIIYLFLLAIHCFALIFSKSKERKFLRLYGIVCGAFLAILVLALFVKLGNRIERQLVYYAILLCHVSGFIVVLNYYFEMHPEKEEEIVNDDIIDAK